MIPEKEVVKECLEYLQSLGIYAWRQNTGAGQYQDSSGQKRFVRFGIPGVSDILGILPNGRFLAVECKSETGKLSDSQAEFLAEIKQRGGLTIVAHSFRDIESAIEENQTQKKSTTGN
jgi:hypothetical protein